MLQKFLLTLKGILWSWQGAYSFMGLPVFSPVFALGFVITLLMSLRSIPQTVFAWSLLAIPVLLITELISGAVLEVHALHQMGVIPYICVLAGVGLAWLWEKLHFQRARALTWGLRGALLIGLFAPTLFNMSYYLQTFIPSEYSDPQWSWRKAQTDVDLGHYVSQHNDQAFLMPYSEYIRPDVAWTLAAGFRERTSAINAEGLLNIQNPPSTLTVIHMSDPARPRHDGYPARPDDRLWVLLHGNTVYLLPPLTDDQVNGVLGSGASTPLVDASGTEVATFVTFPTPNGLFAARQVINHRVDAVFDGRVRLLGYTAPADEIQPGISEHVTLYWQALEPLPVDYEVFAQLWTDSAQAISISHVYPFSGMYRSRLWHTDEIIATHHYLEVPQVAAPGRYTLIGGMFRYLLNQDASAAGENADPLLHIAQLGAFRMPRLPDSAEAPPISPIVFGDQIQISGLDITQNSSLLTGGSVQRGSSIDIRVTWEALVTMPTDYHVFIHLTQDPSAPPTSQTDSIIGESYPTGVWRLGERLTSTYRLAVPADLELGSYQLVIGVYDWSSGTRLTTVTNETIVPLIGSLEVSK
jgi:hypothetical protein